MNSIRDKIYVFISTRPYSYPFIGSILLKRRLRKLEAINLPVIKESDEEMLQRIKEQVKNGQK